MASIGIDLGTTHSLLAYFDDLTGPTLIESANGSVLTPSVVGLSEEKRIIIGEAALERLVTHPKSTFATFKRTIGTEKHFNLGREQIDSSGLSSLILKKLKNDFFNSHADKSIENIVISVPAYFNSNQREATMLAAELAGLKEPRLINEPTAAALAYGIHERDQEQTVIVLDLGGGTFDVSIVEMFEGVMEVRSSSGDAFLGGEDFTEVVFEDVLKQINVLREKLSNEDLAKIKAIAERLKKHLSNNSKGDVSFEIDQGGYSYSITREHFEEISAPLLLKMRRPIERCLYDAKISPDQIDSVILVGGATRMQMMRAMVARTLRRFPEAGIDPDEVVARGAAVQAALIANNSALSDMVMTDVAPFSLGIRANLDTAHGKIQDGFSPIIERNTILPASRENYYYTVQDNQTHLAVDAYQGESPHVIDNVKIGSTQVTVPQNKAGAEAMAVRFSYDTSGLLQVNVRVHSTGLERELIIEGRAANLSKSEKAARLKALETYKMHPRDDEENLAVVEKLKTLYAMMLGSDRNYVSDILAKFEGVLQSQDPKIISKVRKDILVEIEQLERNYVR